MARKKKETPLDKLKKAKKLTEKQLLTQLNEYTAHADLIAAIEEHRIGNLKSYDDYEEMMKDIEKEVGCTPICEGCVGLEESECIDCGRKFKCQPLVDDQCHDCYNTIILNEEDSKLLTDLLLN